MAIQQILFAMESDWRLPNLSDLPKWSAAPQVGLDIETCDPQLKKLGVGVRRDGYIVGVSFAIGQQAWYLPVAHGIGENLDPQKVYQYLRDQAESYTGEIVGANLQYDLDYLAQQGIVFRKARISDVQVAEALIDENQFRYSLASIASRRGLSGKDEQLLSEAASDYKFNKKGELWKLPAKYVGPYAEEDALLPLKILDLQKKDIAEQGLQRVWDLESALLPVLLKMRRRGVRIDTSRLSEIEQRMLSIEQVQAAHISELTGTAFTADLITKDRLLATLVERTTGVQLPLTDKGHKSVDKHVLSSIDHALARAILKCRRANKIRTTFVKSIRSHMVNGRIHCSFHQLRRERHDGGLQGAAYGRLSSTDPNLQQQPVRDEIAEDWRCIYLPDEGGVWCCNDYSQQEPRILLHWASVCAEKLLLESHRTREVVEAAVQRYHADPSMDSHQMMSELTGLPRKEAKQLYLALCYGRGTRSLAVDLGLPTEIIRHRGRNIEVAGVETMKIHETFNERAPYVRWMAELAETRVREQGFLTTFSGRRCRFTKDNLGNYEFTHKSLNRLIQGSAADQGKQAMVDADRAGFRLQLQVHDEIDQTVSGREEAEALADVMRKSIPLRVPVKVDTELGPNWGDIE